MDWLRLSDLEETSCLMSVFFLLIEMVVYDLIEMTAARIDELDMPSLTFPYQKFSFGNTGRVCKTLQTILRDKKVEFYVT